jgi:uncharacterized protein (TIGR00369 family)
VSLERAPVLGKEQIAAFMASDFPQSKCIVEEVGSGSSILRYKTGFEALRPGGTISGPVLMTVADAALYVAILATIGMVPLAVTTNLNINFLRKPVADRDILGHCQLIKVGKTLAIGEVSIYSDGMDAMVAHAVGTYSIPPPRQPSTP